MAEAHAAAATTQNELAAFRARPHGARQSQKVRQSCSSRASMRQSPDWEPSVLIRTVLLTTNLFFDYYQL